MITDYNIFNNDPDIQSIAWTSDEYVEPGTELDFGVFNIIGDTCTAQ